MEASGKLAQLVERQAKLVAGFREGRARGCRVGIELLERDAQRQRERDQALLCTVVEIALETAPRDVAGSNDPRTRCG